MISRDSIGGIQRLTQAQIDELLELCSGIGNLGANLAGSEWYVQNYLTLYEYIIGSKEILEQQYNRLVPPPIRGR